MIEKPLLYKLNGGVDSTHDVDDDNNNNDYNKPNFEPVHPHNDHHWSETTNDDCFSAIVASAFNSNANLCQSYNKKKTTIL